MKGRGGILIIALAACLIAADKKPRQPDLEILEASAHRGEVRTSVEGRIRNSSDRPLKKVTLLFHFMAPGKQVVTTQKGAIEEELLDPGQEASFHMELNSPPRSVEFAISAVEGSGRDLRIGKPGPFPIE